MPAQADPAAVAVLLKRLAGGENLSSEERSMVMTFIAAGELRSSAQPLKLTPAPSPAAGDHGVTGAQLRQWEARYNTKHRQIRRWIERGLKVGDPCPLDEPALMPAWIEKHIEKVRGTLRDAIQVAAEAAAPVTASPIPSAPAPAATASPLAAPLDLATVGGVEGETVEIFRRLFAAAKQQLEEAFRLGGREDVIRTLHTRLEKVGESLRKHELAAEAKAKRQGDLLQKAEVLNEVMAALNVMARLEEQRADRVLADVPELPPELAARVRESLTRSGESARSLLLNLPALRSLDDVRLDLAA